ncbi:unnamed protein product [Acanthoscelides obtectus]|uniref:Uncharacterized protein n=1 Tax=Acanthoscelides obtectus TaxID=200917 RepID=A0A9P0L4T4_ACAOB|nr:unnamed protein product [Acanthoscelides obtectus]CAK1624645.1 hypothetical protein AOBTE_LOCUS2669 [Acanthoscelides obtectus]
MGLENGGCRENDLYSVIRDHPDYKVDKTVLSTFDGQRRVATVQAMAQKSMDQLALLNTIHNLKMPPTATRIMMQVSPSATIKYVVGDRLFSSAIMNMGTKRHMKFISDMEEGKVYENQKIWSRRF